MSKRAADAQTGDLFDLPHPAPLIPGSMDYRLHVSTLVGHMLEAAKHAGRDRWAVGAEMSRLTSREVSKHMLDAYSAPSKEEYNIPACVMPVLEVATDSWLYSQWLAKIRGARLLVGRDALAAELGKIERQKDELARHERAIREQLRHG